MNGVQFIYSWILGDSKNYRRYADKEERFFPRAHNQAQTTKEEMRWQMKYAIWQTDQA